ncbi:hypothetical protein L7F22_039652 [Adiantum nelumboides]|nr:hypothetical protein [Adiantum nelumboides]
MKRPGETKVKVEEEDDSKPSGIDTGEAPSAEELLEAAMKEEEEEAKVRGTLFKTTTASILNKSPSKIKSEDNSTTSSSSNWLTKASESRSSTKKPNGRLLVSSWNLYDWKGKDSQSLCSSNEHKVFCSDSRKYKTYAQLDDPELHGLLTRNPRAGVHVTNLGAINGVTLRDMVSALNARGHNFTHAIALRPTGWSFKPPSGIELMASDLNKVINWNQSRNFDMSGFTSTRDSTSDFMIYGVPYSEHSSFSKDAEVDRQVGWREEKIEREGRKGGEGETEEDIKSKTTNPSGSETSHRRNGSSSQGHYSSGKHSLSKELGFGEGKTTSNQSHKSNSDSRSRSSHRRVASAPKHTLQPSNSNSSLKIARAAPRMIPLELAPSPPRAVQELTHVNKGSLGLADQGGRSLDDSHKPALKHKRTLKSMIFPRALYFMEGKMGRLSQKEIYSTKFIKNIGKRDQISVIKGKGFLFGLPNSHSHTSSSVQDGVWLDENKENDSSAFISTASRRYAKAAGSRYLFPPPPPTSSTPPPIPTNKFNQRESDSLIETSFPSSLLADREDSVYQLNPEVEDQDRLRVPFSEVPTNSPSTPNRREAPFDSQSSSPSQESPSIIKSVGKELSLELSSQDFKLKKSSLTDALGCSTSWDLKAKWKGNGKAGQR